MLLFPRYGHVGMALAVAACGWVSAALLAVVLLRRRRLHVEAGFWRRMALIVLATVLMGVVVSRACRRG